MTPFHRPKVLILTRDLEAHRRLASALGVAAEIVDGDPGKVEFDVLVTDLGSNPAGQISGRPVFYDAENRDREKAIVLGIGPATEGWADLSLSEDCAPREIGLACSLLGEIARLRRERDQIAQSHQEIQQIADTDPLTGILNRRAWDRLLRLKRDRANATGEPLWMAIVDLDRFKEINDRFGLAVGDRVLTQAAQALQGRLRDTDVIARLGGDEFGLLLTGIAEPNAASVFTRLCAAVADRAVETSSSPLTASVGYALASRIDAADDLFAAAERALRQAKQGGGNRAIRGEVHPSRDST